MECSPVCPKYILLLSYILDQCHRNKIQALLVFQHYKQPLIKIKQKLAECFINNFRECTLK